MDDLLAHLFVDFAAANIPFMPQLFAQTVFLNDFCHLNAQHELFVDG
jgi:hypothetical protein